MENLVNPWQGRRVFLTCHAGFKGVRLSLWLADREAQLPGYALNDITEPNFQMGEPVGS